MGFHDLGRVSAFTIAAFVSMTTIASATSFAEPPPSEDQGYPNSAGGYEQAYVTKDVNVRARPSTSSHVVNNLSRGDFVNVGECRGKWCYVDVTGDSGWMLGRFIGRGENPYHSNGPSMETPEQEPGTYDPQ